MLKNLLLRNHKMDEADTFHAYIYIYIHAYDIILYINCVFCFVR